MGEQFAGAQEEFPTSFKLKAPFETSSVHVVGDFNEWSKTSNPLIYSSERDVWETTINLAAGAYEYRFLINSMNWIKDPANFNWGGEKSNSIIYVKEPKQPVLKKLKPETGSVIRENIFKISAEYWDGRERNELDVKTSKIYIDASPQQIEYIPEKRLIRCYTPKLQDGEHEIKIEAVDNNGNRALPLSSIILVNAENKPPQVDAGYTIIAGVEDEVILNSGTCYDPDFEPLEKYRWRIISKPRLSKAKLKNSKTAFPTIKPDKVGRYVMGLKVSDGYLYSAEDSVDIYGFVRRKYPTEFQFSDSTFTKIYESPVDCVSVAGEFNQWSVIANKMNDYNNDGIWTAWINLEPGEYEYKIVVNGKHWIADPINPDKVADGWNGFNSVKKVSLNLAPFIEVNSSFRPGAILFDAANSYSKTGKELSFFWYQDINNPERYLLTGKERLKIPIPQKPGIYYFYLVVSDSFGSSAKKTIVLKVKDRKVQIQDFSEPPDWAKDAIVYEVFVKKFTPEGTFKGVISKIPYLKSLGINCIWLMPIFESPTENGYGPTNFYRLSPEYGTKNDLKELINSAHQAGIKVVIDFIANHTSDRHRYFVSAFQNQFSVFRDLYCWYKLEEDVLYYQYKFHNDWDRLPNLNYENPQVRKLILDVATKWAEFGIDGFRCDVAWGVPHDFWKLFRRQLKNINPDILLLDETLPRSPKYHDDEFDISYDTDFYGNLLDVMNGRKPVSAINYGLQKTNTNYPAHTLNLRYMENHDMERFISQYSIKKTKLAATLLFTIQGTPLILYGQEIGLRDKLPAMDWSRDGDDLYNFYHKLITLRRNNTCLRRGKMVKISTDVEDKVYAYLRHGDNNSFLVVLNLSKERLDCQLLVKNILNLNKEKNYFEELLSGARINIKLLDSSKIKLKLQPETAYIFKKL